MKFIIFEIVCLAVIALCIGSFANRADDWARSVVNDDFWSDTVYTIGIPDSDAD